MIKRVGIVMGAFLLTLGAFWLFRTLNSPLQWQDDRPQRPRPAAPENNDDVQMIPVTDAAALGQIRGTHFKSRDLQGRLTNEFGFERRLGRQAEAIQFSNPWSVFYDHENGTAVRITALRLTTPADVAQNLPETGELNGDAILTYFRFDPDRSGNIEPAEADVLFKAHMDGLRFERERSRLAGSGEIRLLHRAVEVVGRDLSLQYDQIARQLQELELTHVEKMTFAGELLDAAQTAAPSTDSSNADADDSTDASASPNGERGVYQMALPGDVLVRQGDQRIEAELMWVLMDVHKLRSRLGERSMQVSPDKEDDSSVASDSTDTPADSTEDVELTCSGPLRIVPATTEQRLTPGSAYAVGLYGRPVNVWQLDQYIGQARSLEFQENDSLVTVRAATDTPIEFSRRAGEFVKVGGEVQVNLAEQAAFLSGPGQLRLDRDDASGIALVFSKRLDFGFNMGDPNLPVRWIDFEGAITARSEEGRLEAKEGRLDFFESAQFAVLDEPVEMRPQIRQLLLEDSVKLFYQDNTFASDRLEGGFLLDHSGQSAPQSLTALGQTRVRLPEYAIDTDQRLHLRFRSDTQEDHPSGSRRSPDDFSWYSTEQLERIEARASPGMLDVRFLQENVRIVGHRLEGFVPEDRWEVVGAPARVLSMDPNQPFRDLEGSRILADLQRGTFSIPGPGRLAALMQRDLLGWEMGPARTAVRPDGPSSGQEPFPADLAWNVGVDYDLSDNRVILSDVSVTVQENRPDATRCTWLDGPMVALTLSDPVLAASQGAAARLEVQALRAEGPDLQIRSEERALDDSALLNVMTLGAQRLDFTPATGDLQATGKGAIELRTLGHSGGAQQASERPDGLDRTLRRLLSDDQPGYSLVGFEKELTYQAASGRIHLSDNVLLFQMPLQGGAIPLDAAGMPQVEGMLKLSCDRLDLQIGTPSPSGARARSTSDPVSGLNLQAFRAQGNIDFRTMRDGQMHVVQAPKMRYDRRAGAVYFEGSTSYPVRMDDADFLELIYYVDTGEFRTRPFGQSQWTPRN